MDICTIHGIKKSNADGYADKMAAALPGRSIYQIKWDDLSPGGYVADVLNYEKHKDEITTRVAIMLNFWRPRVVVAHSLGSVVLIDVIRRYGRRFGSLVTLGSPLAKDLYFDRRRGNPPPAFDWTNIYGYNDLVSWFNFWLKPPDNLLAQYDFYKNMGVRDVQINAGGFFKSHGAYWNHKKVIKIINGKLK